MATTKAIYFAGTQVGYDYSSVASGGYTRTRNITALDWGEAPADLFQRPRPLRDGVIRRGRRHGPRTITMQLASEITTAGLSVASIERARDDEWQDIQSLLYPEQGLVTIKHTRTDYSAAAVSRVIRGELQSYKGWTWVPDGIGDGFVGRYDNPLLLMPLNFVCPFPWFEDETATTGFTGQTLDGTLRSTTVTNPGLVACGVKISITAASGTATVRVSNSTISSALAGSGAQLTSISPTATAVILDWYSTDPLGWTVTQGGTDIKSVLSTTSAILLAKGANTITWQVTSGSLTTGQIALTFKPLYGTV